LVILYNCSYWFDVLGIKLNLACWINLSNFGMVNIWIYIQWTYLSIPRQGSRQKITWTFKTMLRQINRATEEKLGFNNSITI
jgi:hypothetical protein